MALDSVLISGEISSLDPEILRTKRHVPTAFFPGKHFLPSEIVQPVFRIVPIHFQRI